MSQATNMMNCENYKEALAADPDFEDESGHVETCADCQAFRQEIATLNQRIAAAMSLTASNLVMPDLPDLDVENVTTLRVRRSVSTPMWLAVAASVALAAFVGVRIGDSGVSGIPLDEQVLAHVDHAPAALLPTSVPVDNGQLVQVVPGTIATMNHDAGLITFAETCPINGKDVPHLVIQGERGPITILLMPDEKISKNQELDGESVYGYLLQVGDGSIAIIGEREEQLDRVKQNVLSSVAWDT